jgi:hypothetical protein
MQVMPAGGRIAHNEDGAARGRHRLSTGGIVAMTIGRIQAFVIGFPSNDLFEGRVADELARLSNVGQLRIIDAVFVMREGDDVSVLSVSDLDDDDRAELRSAVGALVGLGVAGGEGAVLGAALGASLDADAPSAAESVAAGLLEDLPDDSSALVLAIEHLWAVPLRDAVRDAGGVVVAHRSFTAEDLIAFGMDLAEEVQVEADLEAGAAAADSQD